MRVAVVGLGSMGKRRIRILKRLYPQINIVGIDSRDDRRKQVADEYGIETAIDMNVVKNKDIECIFVCTSPQSHSAIFEQIDLDVVHTFSELDLQICGYDRLIEAEKKGIRRHFLSSTPLYNADVNKIIQLALGRLAIAYRYHIGQYLPDWHPWEDYRDFFAAHKETNACKEIMAIEFPWIERCFGRISKADVVSRRISTLDIEFNDVLALTVQHESGVIGQLFIDVILPKPTRELEIVGEHFYLRWNGQPNGVQIWNKDRGAFDTLIVQNEVIHQPGYAEFIAENPYEEELKEFFAGISDPTIKYRFSYSESYRLLQLIDKIESKR